MRFLHPTLLLVCLLASGALADAQSLRLQPTPFSVWLDFDALAQPDPPAVSLPIWLESVNAIRPPVKAAGDELTTFRLRLRHVGELNREIEMRLFFDDLPGVQPVVTGWTETGVAKWTSGPIGSGLGLSTSETYIVPAGNLDYLEITVPGRGSTVRGVFLSSVRLTETRFALDFAAPGRFTDPFGRLSPLPPAQDDSLLLGRVKASLEVGPTKLTAAAPLSWIFSIERVPDLVLVNFEVLNPDLGAPPSLTVNGHIVGAVSLQLPDLADPGYVSSAETQVSDLHFRYTGWLRAQAVLPASALRTGDNELDLVLGSETPSVALRAVELQLKYPGSKSTGP